MMINTNTFSCFHKNIQLMTGYMSQFVSAGISSSCIQQRDKHNPDEV